MKKMKLNLQVFRGRGAGLPTAHPSGGGHSPLVILKSDSKAIPYAQYVIDGQGEEIREGVIDE